MIFILKLVQCEPMATAAVEHAATQDLKDVKDKKSISVECIGESLVSTILNHLTNTQVILLKSLVS